MRIDGSPACLLRFCSEAPYIHLGAPSVYRGGWDAILLPQTGSANHISKQGHVILLQAGQQIIWSRNLAYHNEIITLPSLQDGYETQMKLYTWKFIANY